MKIKINFLMIVLLAAEVLADPLLVVVLMVKNEASVIVQTLQPFVDGGVKDFVVFDTGSTDGTQDIAREFFKQHNLINAHIIEEPFIDFSTSRNHALEQAQHIFPHATFMLMPDAEWYMHNVESLLQFCDEHKDEETESYFVLLKNDTVSLYSSRLIRCNSDIRFVGPVHEALNKLTTVTLPDDIYFEWRPSQKGIEKSVQRWQRDKDLLLQSYAQNPFDARTLFYLAQTYECLGEWQNAYIFYKKRADIFGWPEENYITRFRLGDVAQHLAPRDASICPLAVQHYMEAFAMRPHRAEPLIKIAQYYLSINNMHLAYIFAVQAAQIPYPAQDVLFVEKYMYDFVRYDILRICALYVGQYEIGEWAVKQALKIHPDAAHLQRNLLLYAEHAVSL